MPSINSAGSIVADNAVGYTSEASFLPVAATIGAGDVMTGAKEFTYLGPSSGGEVVIEGTKLVVEHSALIASEAGYTLHLYSVTPPSAIADNGVWDITTADRASYQCSIALGTPVDLGSTLCVHVDGINKQVTIPVGGSLWAYLETDAGFTPTAALRVVTLHARSVS